MQPPADGPAPRQRLRVLACALLGVLVAACGSPGTPSRPQSFNLAGYSAQYKRGHADGCAQRRDERLYRDEGDYMMGWNDGRGACAKARR